MTTKKHILIVSPGFPAHDGDDSCIPALQEYLRSMLKTYPNMRVTVIALHYPFTSSSYRWSTIDVFPLGGSNSSIKKPILWYRAVRRAQSIHLQYPVDVVHSFWLGECAMVGSFIAKHIGAPHVCTIMGQELRQANWYASLLRSGATRFFALSPFQEKDFQRRMGRRADGIICWGVDAATIGVPEPPRTASGRDIDFLGVGSLIVIKNFPLFLAAASAAARNRPGLRCVIAGDGPDRAAIESIIRENGLENNVTLTGMIPRHEVLTLMRRSKMLLHPSLYEGFGYVFAEALACGMHVVSFDVGSFTPRPRWHLARGQSEFPGVAEQALDTATDYSPDMFFSVTEPVSRYASVYGLDTRGGKY